MQFALMGASTLLVGLFLYQWTGDLLLTVVGAIYVVGGWARQRAAEGELLTVFDLVLSHLELQRSSGVGPHTPDTSPLAVRVVVHETSGDVTLTRRR